MQLVCHLYLVFGAVEGDHGGCTHRRTGHELHEKGREILGRGCGYSGRSTGKDRRGFGKHIEQKVAMEAKEYRD